MAVSKSIKDALQREYGVSVSNTLPQISLPQISIPKISDVLPKAPTKEQKQANLKQEVLALPAEAREALRKNAFPTPDGKGFILPSVDNKELGRYEGLRFTNDEWGKGAAAKYTGATAKYTGTTISKGTGNEKKVSDIDVIKEGLASAASGAVAGAGAGAGIGAAVGGIPGAIVGGIHGGITGSFVGGTSGVLVKGYGYVPEGDIYSPEFQKYVAQQRLTSFRVEERRAIEKAAGVDYLTKLGLMAPSQDMYMPFSASDPLTYIDAVSRTADSFGRSVGSASVDVGSNLLGTLEALTPYDSFANNYARQVRDELDTWRIKQTGLNQLDSVKGFLQGGWSDPAYYASIVGGTIPHVIGQMGASMLGAFAGSVAGPVGSFAGATTAGLAYSTSQGYGDIYTEMLENGYDMSDARNAAAVGGTIIGAIDSVVPGKIAGRILTNGAKEALKQKAKQIVKNELIKTIIKTGGTVLQEGVTETVQEFVQNTVNKYYDSTKDIWENLPDAFIGGVIGGGFFAGVEGVLTRKEKPVQAGPGARADQARENVQQAEAMNDQSQDPTAPPSDAGSQIEPDTMPTETLEDTIQSLYENARAEEATILMGEKFLAQEANPEIARVVQESRAKLSEYNDNAKMVLVEFASRDAQEIVSTENVRLKVGTLPDGQFVASGEIKVNGRSLNIQFDVDNARPMRSEAAATVVAQMNSWFSSTLKKQGIQNNPQVDEVYNTLMDIDTSVLNAEQFVSANQEAVLTAQDMPTVEDFEATVQKENINVGDQDLRKLYARANDPDSIYLTEREARNVAQDLAGDLGVDVQFVDEISTNKRALGRFVQRVYGGQVEDGGTIELRKGGDKTQDGERNIKMSTPYHEVGHAYFRNLLLPEEQSAILDAVREKYKDEGMSDADAEEKLVEDMKGYVLKTKKLEGRYGQLIAKIIELAEKLVAWLGNNPNRKMDEFYSNVLSKKRPSERKASQIARQKQDLSDVRTEYFQEPMRLTSKFLKHKEILGREFISYQHAKNVLKGAGLKKAEADLINAVLDTQFNDVRRIPVEVLENAIIGELLPLEVKDSYRYAEYGLDRVDMEDWDSATHIYEGPVEHGISGHFGGDTEKLFGHTRIATDGKIRAVLEVQSDFFQKVRGDDIRLPTVSSIAAALDIIKEYKDLPLDDAKAALHGKLKANSQVMDALWTGTPNGNADYMVYQILKNSDTFSWYKNAVAALNQQMPKAIGIDKLRSYANIWHERMIKEEIRLAAMDDITKFRVPTGRTLATIEGYEGTNNETPYNHTRPYGERLEVGDEIEMGGDFYYVVSADSDSDSIRVAMRDNARSTPQDNAGYELEVDGEIFYFNNVDVERLSQPSAYEDGAIFDIANMPEEQRAVVKFYDSKVVPFFKKLRKDATEVTDENGFTWLETTITPLDMDAVEAFQTEESTKNSIPTGNELMLNTIGTVTGEPVKLRAYHGTNAKFDKFEIRDGGKQYSGRGVYFTPEKNHAERFGKNVMEVYLDIKNPYVKYLPEDNIDAQFIELSQEVANSGYDAMIIRSSDTDTKTGERMADWINEIVVFDTSVIKDYSEIEAFQELEIPATPGGRPDPMKIVGYKSMPATEQALYTEVVNRINTANKELIPTKLETVENAARQLELAYKYEQHLMRDYGFGYEQAVSEYIERLDDAVQTAMVMQTTAMEFSVFPYSDQYRIAKDILGVARPIAAIVRKQTDRLGKTLDDIFSAGYDDLTRIVGDYIRNGTPTQEEIAAFRIFEAAGESVGEAVVVDDPENDYSAYQEEMMDRVRRGIDGNRILVSRLKDDALIVGAYVDKVARNAEENARLRRQLVEMRQRAVEREEAHLRMRMETNTKRRIHANIMRKPASITMSQSDYYNTQAKAAERAARATKREVNEQYRLLKRRRDILNKIKDTRTTLKKRIKDGKTVDVSYAKKLLEFFDSFQDSAPSKRTVELLAELKRMKFSQGGLGGSIDDSVRGDVGNMNNYTEADRKADEEYIAYLEKRLGKKALSQMSLEDLNRLYSEIDQLVTEGRITLQMKKYLNEQERLAEIERVTTKTTPLQNTKLQEARRTMGGEKAVNRGVNTAQNITGLFTAQYITDMMDGGQYGTGVNSDLNRDLSEAEVQAGTMLNKVIDDFNAAWVANGLPKTLTEKEHQYVTLVGRIREGEHGEFVASQISKQQFNGEIPAGVGRITREDAEVIIDIMQDLYAKYAITENLAATFEAVTNKIFPKVDNYVAPSKFTGDTAPTNFVSAEQAGLDIMQTFARNGTGVSDKFSLKRQAGDESLIPRGDIINLFLGGVQHSLWYIHMQPAISNVREVVMSEVYQRKVGKVGTTWWEEHLSLLAQRGRKVGAPQVDWVDQVRFNVTGAMLAFKASTVLMQLGQPVNNAIAALPVVGIEGAARIMLESAKALDPRYAKAAAENVEIVALRRGTAGSYDIADMRKRGMQDGGLLGPLSTAREAAIEWGMKPMQYLDTGFYAASNKAMYDALIKQGMDDAEATRMAAYYSESFNTSTLLSNKPHVLSGGSWARAVFMLQSFTMGWLSLMLTMTNSVIRGGSTKQRIYGAITIAMAPIWNSLFNEMVSELLNGEDPEDKEKNIAERFFWEYVYSLPIAGGIARSALEFNKVQPVNSAALSMVIRFGEATLSYMNSSNEETKKRAATRMLESGFSLVGVPYTAQAFDLLGPWIQTDGQRKTSNIQAAGRELAFGDAANTDIDAGVRKVVAETYGDRLEDMEMEDQKKEKENIRKSLIKAMAANSDISYVRDVAKKSKNDEKVVILIEASKNMSGVEFQSMISDLRKYKLLSDEGYDKYLKAKSVAK